MFLSPKQILAGMISLCVVTIFVMSNSMIQARDDSRLAFMIGSRHFSFSSLLSRYQCSYGTLSFSEVRRLRQVMYKVASTKDFTSLSCFLSDVNKAYKGGFFSTLFSHKKKLLLCVLVMVGFRFRISLLGAWSGLHSYLSSARTMEGKQMSKVEYGADSAFQGEEAASIMCVANTHALTDKEKVRKEKSDIPYFVKKEKIPTQEMQEEHDEPVLYYIAWQAKDEVQKSNSVPATYCDAQTLPEKPLWKKLSSSQITQLLTMSREALGVVEQGVRTWNLLSEDKRVERDSSIVADEESAFEQRSVSRSPRITTEVLWTCLS